MSKCASSMPVSVELIDDLAEVRDLIQAVWMMAGELEDAQKSCVRRVIDVVDGKLDTIGDRIIRRDYALPDRHGS